MDVLQIPDSPESAAPSAWQKRRAAKIEAQTTPEEGAFLARQARLAPKTELGRKLVADRLLDRTGPLHRGPRHHALIVGGEIGERPRSGVEGMRKAPIQAEEMDIGDRVACERPIALAQSSIGKRKHGVGARDAEPARRVDRRRDERHP